MSTDTKQTPWLKDREYQRGEVPMTKEEVRWLSLIKLQLQPGDRVLDIGAGTGSVTLGAARLVSPGVVTAVEKNPEAVRLIRENAKGMKTANLHIIEGAAPEALEGLGSYEGVFIGGSGGNMAELVKWSAAHLTDGGRIVINTVTLENSAEALAAIKAGPFEEVEIIQVSVSRGRFVGKLTMWESQNPVVILSATRRLR